MLHKNKKRARDCLFCALFVHEEMTERVGRFGYVSIVILLRFALVVVLRFDSAWCLRVRCTYVQYSGMDSICAVGLELYK